MPNINALSFYTSEDMIHVKVLGTDGGDSKIVQSEVARNCEIENYFVQMSTIFASKGSGSFLANNRNLSLQR